jgi:hypothetical protein
VYTKAQMKAWMDALFAGVEAKAANAPWGLGQAFNKSLTALQKQADDHFDAIYAQLQQDEVITVDAFFNALLATFAGSPFVALAIGLAKQFIDAQLVSAAAVAANCA